LSEAKERLNTLETKFKEQLSIMSNLKNAQNLISERAWAGLMRFRELQTKTSHKVQPLSKNSQIQSNHNNHSNQTNKGMRTVTKPIPAKMSPKKDTLEIKGYSTPTLVESESNKHLVVKKEVEEKSVKLVGNLGNFETEQKDGSFF